MKNEFSDESVENAREVLQTMDNGCDHGYYRTYYVESSDKSSDLSQLEDMKSHPPGFWIMPGCHVLNDLYTEPVPEELSNLKALVNQFNQRAKCLVRLGTYKGKVPIYNHVKAVKGTMFFTAKHAGGSWLHFSPDDIVDRL